MNWTNYFFTICDAVASKSKDPSTQVGSIIVGPANEIRTTGYNGFPRGIFDHPSRLNDRKIKYPFTVHAELNAILTAARNGVSLEHCVLYSHWYPCHECAKAIIQSGIQKVIISDVFMKSRGTTGWEDSFEMAKIMLDEAAIQVIFYDVNTKRFIQEIEEVSLIREVKPSSTVFTRKFMD